MTSVQFISFAGRLIGFEAWGHTGYAPAGKDIVCAGVSTLVQTTVLGLEKLIGIKVTVNQEKKTGHFYCRIASNTEEEKQVQADFVLHLTYLGLQQIATEYKDYVRVSIKEVEKNEV